MTTIMTPRLLVTGPKILSAHTSRLIPSSSFSPLPCHASFCQRAFSTSVVGHNEAKFKRPGDSVSKGAEGAHRHDVSANAAAVSRLAHTTHPSDSIVPHVHGLRTLFHPVYTEEELKTVAVLHRDAKTISDKVALLLVRLLRTGFDFVSGYKHKSIPESAKNMSTEELRKAGYLMNERQWLHRILFLETIAGVPGMVGAMVRHLMSLRLMKRDLGWIRTLLEEAENERLHLLTFMTLRKPSIWFRAMVLGAQGVFFNTFFLSYLLSPRTCHRFVGFLEEEAVITYTRVIQEIEQGRLPEWSNLDAPAIAKDYWRLRPDAKLLDVMYAVRSDESTHRFVNHTLADLDIKKDANPFAIREPDMFIKGVRPGFTREESINYALESFEFVNAGSKSSK